MEAILILIGIPLGILSSLVAWWILFHCIVPKLKFSSSISKTKSDDNGSGYRYRIKIDNSGRRSIVDLELFARLRVKGLRKGYPENWEILYIPLGYGNIPKFRPSKKTNVRNVLRLQVHKMDKLTNPIYPDIIKTRSANDSLSLEDLFSLGTEASLQAIIFGYDEFSGTRKVFESKRYTVKDIALGSFKMKSLDIIENT